MHLGGEALEDLLVQMLSGMHLMLRLALPLLFRREARFVCIFLVGILSHWLLDGAPRWSSESLDVLVQLLSDSANRLIRFPLIAG